ncbi:MAG: glycosyltransferase family 2 protein [Candidatus Magasanikbacteria bacterium]
MKISLITISYNSAKTIEKTIQSVLSQTYTDIEYIIIDGASTDGTLKIFNKYKDKISKIISEKDKGIYDAMNKGISLATGDVVGIINSDDFYIDEFSIAKVMDCFENNKVDACYANLEYLNRENIDKKVRSWRAGEYDQKKLSSGWAPPHPTFFVKKEIYEKYGKFNLDFKIAADYELMLRFLIKGINIVYINENLVCMREGGHSAKSVAQRIKGWQEIRKSWQVNNRQVPKCLIFRRILSKLSQYI